jgi:agmatine deiminase
MISPKNDGYTFPFDGLAHEGTIILFPYREYTWEDGGLKAFPEFKSIIETISMHEHVYVIKSPKVKYDTSCLNMKNVSIHELDYDDSWARDNTLIFLKKDNKFKAVDFGFNAWGGKVDGLYSNWEDDKKLGSNLSKLLNIECYLDKDFILEGGSIHPNGNKTLLTTEVCLLSKGRNSKLSKEEIENHLKEMLGMDKVLWIPDGIYNDETNEHIENMACFLDENTILLATSKDTNDIQYKWSMEAKRILENETTASGK